MEDQMKYINEALSRFYERIDCVIFHLFDGNFEEAKAASEMGRLQRVVVKSHHDVVHHEMFILDGQRIGFLKIERGGLGLRCTEAVSNYLGFEDGR